MPSPIILHLDMDAFFASVEQREHPEYKGKPVIVGADPKGGKGRGVVSSPSYEARKSGVKSGMPISIAYKLCPDAVFLPVNMQLYIEASDSIMSFLRALGYKMEQVSIDEAFLDISPTENITNAKKLSQEIKSGIMEKENLPCSIGIGPNKLIAKIASDYKKPNGLTAVSPQDIKAWLWPQPVNKLWGVGKVTSFRLKELGIRTIGDLANASTETLSPLGKWGNVFREMAQGIYSSEVEEQDILKSMSREVTFETDTTDWLVIEKTIDQISEDLATTARELGLVWRTATIKIRYSDFETHTHQQTVGPQKTLDELKLVAKELLRPFLQSSKPIRLVGLKVGNFVFDIKQKKLSQFMSSQKSPDIKT